MASWPLGVAEIFAGPQLAAVVMVVGELQLDEPMLREAYIRLLGMPLMRVFPTRCSRPPPTARSGWSGIDSELSADHEEPVAGRRHVAMYELERFDTAFTRMN